MGYTLSVSEVRQTADLTYSCSDDTPPMSTAASLRQFRPDRVDVALERRAGGRRRDGDGAWQVAGVLVAGFATDQPRGGTRRHMRRFTPPAPEDRQPPWLGTLLTHALRTVTEGATLPLPAAADTV